MDGIRFTAGSRAKSDCSVAYAKGVAPISVALRSSVASLFGKAIEAAVLRVAAEFGVEGGGFEVDDDGALDGTVAARAEAALRMAGFTRKSAAAPAAPARRHGAV